MIENVEAWPGLYGLCHFIIPQNYIVALIIVCDCLMIINKII